MSVHSERRHCFQQLQLQQTHVYTRSVNGSLYWDEGMQPHAARVLGLHDTGSRCITWWRHLRVHGCHCCTLNLVNITVAMPGCQKLILPRSQQLTAMATDQAVSVVRHPVYNTAFLYHIVAYCNILLNIVSISIVSLKSCILPSLVNINQGILHR